MDHVPELCPACIWTCRRTKCRNISLWTYDVASVGQMVCVIPGLLHELDENCALLGCYAESCRNSLPNPIRRLETSLSIYYYSLRNSPAERSSRKMVCQRSFDMMLTSRNGAKLNFSTTAKPTLVLNYCEKIISLNTWGVHF